MNNSQFPDIEEIGDCLIDEFEDALLGEQVDMCGPADEAIDVLGRVDIEVHIHPMDYLIPQDTLHHLALYTTTTVALLGVAGSRRVPRHVAVLAAR